MTYKEKYTSFPFPRLSPDELVNWLVRVIKSKIGHVTIGEDHSVVFIFCYAQFFNWQIDEDPL